MSGAVKRFMTRFGEETNTLIQKVPTISPGMRVLSATSGALSLYHGYKRNDSLGWGLLWGLAGSALPVVVPVIALAQGFGKRVK